MKLFEDVPEKRQECNYQFLHSNSGVAVPALPFLELEIPRASSDIPLMHKLA